MNNNKEYLILQERSRLIEDFVYDEKDYQSDSHGMHELVDRAAIINEQFENLIYNHPACFLDKELFDQAYNILGLLNDFYQEAARKHFNTKELNH